MEVKKSASNENFYLTLLYLFKKGLNPAKISKKLHLPKQNINYYLRRLKDEGLIKKKGYGVWEVNEEVKIVPEHPTQKGKNFIRGHAFIWKVKLHKKYDWKNLLKRKKYKLIRNCIPRIYIGNNKVWLGKKAIIIYEPNSFMGMTSIDSKKHAVIRLLEIISKIEQNLKVSLRPYAFNSSREHYAMIKNELAKQCNRYNEKIRIVDDGKEWLWIDDSDSLGELETGNDNALVNNLGVQKWWNDMKRTDFEWTPSVVAESIGGLIQNQQMHSRNIIKHQKVLDEMLITLKKIQKSVESEHI